MTSVHDGPTQDRPARNTRPSNRRALIVAAASTLFYEHGYANVAMSDVAEAVAIGPSALYRHFRGKQQLLGQVVADALDTFVDALARAESDDTTDLAEVLATAALEHRTVGVLWRREARHLSEEDRKDLRAETRLIGERLMRIIGARRPQLSAAESDLLAWCALAVANSMSFHRVTLPAPESATLLTELVAAVLDASIELPVGAAASNRTAGLLNATRSRREAILGEAIVLFADKGFAGVSMDDIGASVGIAGPSVYGHFAAKTDILVAAMFRGDEWLQMDMRRALGQSTDSRDGVRRLLDSYASFAMENPHLVRILVSESAHLPDTERHRSRVAQHDYIAKWVHLVRTVHPEWDTTVARIRVQAAQALINDVALTPHLRTRPGIAAAIASIGRDLLGVT
ncbi:TetR/AcrR family transcriptional regulator [Antrihabitans sp. NCIMB 15449]|uniref:TetR/AcrR family transcriptional regulator n=1 Tax=Antrihabitans spumae TaxID=3373370 RepID=A0ABW7JV46_9NOCA